MYLPEFIMYRSWNDDFERLHKLASHNIMKRLIRHSDDAKAISDHIQAITWSIQNLTVQFTRFSVQRLLIGFCTGVGRECAGD
jgi:hypothetical protein